MEVLIPAGGKKCCRVREGAGDGVDAQCGRRGFRSMAAIEKALELGLKDLTIYYDYIGNRDVGKDSGSAIRRVRWPITSMCARWRIKIRLSFVKVKGHSGVMGNEEADRLAKARLSE